MIEEKDKIINDMLVQQKKFESEKNEIVLEYNKAKKEIKDFSEVRNNYDKNVKQISLDKEILTKAIEDLNSKVNDIYIKNVKLEQINKSLVETSYETKKEELEKNYKLIIDKQKLDIIELEKQIMNTRNENESDAIRLKTTLLMNEKLNSEIENLKHEINEKNTTIKICNKNVEEASDRADKLRILLEEEKNKCYKKEDEIKSLVEKNIMKETEVKSIRLELDRLIQSKEKQNQMSKIY
jgi:chromosome segregation ATPase